MALVFIFSKQYVQRIFKDNTKEYDLFPLDETRIFC